MITFDWSVLCVAGNTALTFLYSNEKTVNISTLNGLNDWSKTTKRTSDDASISQYYVILFFIDHEKCSIRQWALCTLYLVDISLFILPKCCHRFEMFILLWSSLLSPHLYDSTKNMLCVLFFVFVVLISIFFSSISMDLTLLCAELLNRTANGLSFIGSIHSSHMHIVAHYAPNNFTVLIFDEQKRWK